MFLIFPSNFIKLMFSVNLPNHARLRTEIFPKLRIYSINLRIYRTDFVDYAGEDEGRGVKKWFVRCKGRDAHAEEITISKSHITADIRRDPELRAAADDCAAHTYITYQAGHMCSVASALARARPAGRGRAGFFYAYSVER